MEKLYTVQEIGERYGCNDRTARRYMREMGALNIRPMKVQECAVIAWEARNKLPQPPTAEEKKTRLLTDKQLQKLFMVKPVPPKPGQYISRERPPELRKAK